MPRRQIDGSKIDAVKVVESDGGGFFLITREEENEFDVWVESLEELKSDLDSLQVDWCQVVSESEGDM